MVSGACLTFAVSAHHSYFVPIRSTICACAALVAAACGASQKTIHKAETSGYDTDFAIVFSEALAAVQELYPHLDENPSAGWIKTSWHQLKISQSNTTHEAQGIGVGETPNPNSQVSGDPNQVGGGSGVFGGTRTTGTLYFIRFRVYVLGGRPWRVRVEAEAAEYEPGLKPAPLKGADVPPWLKPRAQALQVSVYKRLEQYAVRIDARPTRWTEIAQPKKAPQLGKYGAIPKPAAARVHALRGALLAGDFDKVRTFLVEEFVWSAGATPSADQALMMWKADPTILSRLVSSLDSGCSASDDKTVACPVDAKSGQLRATFAEQAGEWKLTSFVSAE